MKIITVLFVLLCQSLFAGTPTEALTAFLKGAKTQSLEETPRHTAQFEGLDDDFEKYLQSRIKRILDLSAKGWTLEIVEEKIIGDCAVLLCNDKNAGDGKNAFDPDPVFLNKQNGAWKVLPSLTEWNLLERVPAEKQPASMKLDETKVAAYKQLEKWFDERGKALKKEKHTK